MNTSPTPQGPGSVSGAPNLPAGFAGTFTSRYVDVGDLRLHAVTGGEGPPLLLVHGCPGTRPCLDAWHARLPAASGVTLPGKARKHRRPRIRSGGPCAWAG